MSLFAELRRRNVFRVGAAYVAIAWLVIQVVETLFPVFGLGDEAIRIVVILLAVGFLPAVVSAWAFELTPQGFKREAEVDHDSPVSRRMNRRLDRLFVVALTLALGFFAFDKFVLDPARDREQLEKAVEEAKVSVLAEVEEQVRERSVAVLAFQDLSPAGDQQYFADGLAADLISQLGNVPELRVTGKTSAFSFKGKDATIPDIGKALNVAHVVDGSVSRSGDRLRISVQLMDARGDRQLWSETYDRTLGDIFGIRDEITLAVFDRLTIEFERLEWESLRTDPEAYDLTLQATYLDDLGEPESISQAADLLNRALEIDPNYVPALLASVYVNYGLMSHGVITDEEEGRRFREINHRVLAVDPTNGTALGALAWEDWETRLDLESAARRFSDALRTAPGNLELTQMAGMFARSIGRHGEAVALLERCSAADPENSRCPRHLALAYLWAGRLDDALDAFGEVQSRAGRQFHPYYLILTLLLDGTPERALEELELLGPEFAADPQGLAARAMIAHELGNPVESAAALRTLVAAMDPSWRDQAYLVAQAYAWTGQEDAAFDWLDKAYALDERYGQHGYWFHRIMFLPVWRNIRGDPRWSEFLKKANMSPDRLAALEFTTPPWILPSAD